MEKDKYNCVVLLGPTAVGKTAIACRLAYKEGGEVISADSRQVYRGLDIASGKDLSEYNVDGTPIPYHLIDICDIKKEYSVFDYQRDFYALFPSLIERGVLPIVTGGTGMYLDSILRGYKFVNVPVNKNFREEAKMMSMESLAAMLLSLKGSVHGGEDIRDRERCIKAIEIALYMQSKEGKEKMDSKVRPRVKCLVIGTTLERSSILENIQKRLNERIKEGMIEEIEGLHREGASWERLEALGLEAKYVSLYIQGKIANIDELKDSLFIAIRQFAKRQETWFRGMERKGVAINWLPPIRSVTERLKIAANITQTQLGQSSRLYCPSR